MPYFYIDSYYIILVVPALILALIAQVMVKSTFRRYSSKLNSRGITGAAAANAVLNYYGISNVRIERVGGNLTDHFDPKSNVIRLSEDVYQSASIAAVGVACHEAGHAAQHAEHYIPVAVRNKLVPVCNIGSTLGIPLAVIGLFLGIYPLVSLGLIMYGCVFLFQLVTLPVELNASKRALKVIEETGLLYGEENSGAKKVLISAAMTYVASMIVALANLLRFVLKFSRRNN